MLILYDSRDADPVDAAGLALREARKAGLNTCFARRALQIYMYPMCVQSDG
jgi:hypothetical protein